MWQASSLPTSMPKLLPWAWALPHSLPSRIIIFTPVSDCQSLITTLSRAPARQSDSVCNSVWFHHSSISKTSSIRVQWIPACAGIADNTGRLGGQAELHPSSVLGPARPSNAAAKVLIRRTGQEEFHGRYIRDLHSATHRTLTGETNSQAHWRFGWTRSQCITFAQLTLATVRFWPATFTASDDNSLQCVRTAEATTRRHSIFFFAVCHTHRHVPLPTADPRRMWSFLVPVKLHSLAVESQLLTCSVTINSCYCYNWCWLCMCLLWQLTSNEFTGRVPVQLLQQNYELRQNTQRMDQESVNEQSTNSPETSTLRPLKRFFCHNKHLLPIVTLVNYVYQF